MDKYFEILEEIATSIAGTMAPTPNDVIGRVTFTTYTKEKTKHGDKKAMRNYKFKKNGELNRKPVNEDEAARKAVLDRKAEQLNRNSNEFIMTGKPEVNEPNFKLTQQPKNDSAIKQKLIDDNKKESTKLAKQAAPLYKWARKHDEESAAKLGDAIIRNMKLHKGAVSESCFNDIVNMILEYFMED